MTPLSAPVLSVCIPTFRRADCLDRGTRALAQQIREDRLADHVELCISDNASPDRTPEVLAQLQADFPDIRIVRARNPENLGFSGNFYRVVQLATGEYLAFTGDDDQIKSGALRRMIEATRQGDDVIFFNTFGGPGGQWRRDLPPEDFARTPIRSTAEANELLGVFHASFLGNLVCRRQPFQAAYHPELNWSWYPHTCVVLELLKGGHGAFHNYATFHVDDSHRDWRPMQPWLSSIDMARVQTDHAPDAAPAIYGTLVRTIPQAVLYSRLNPDDQPRRFSPTTLRACYRSSLLYQFIAVALWAVACVLPVSILKRLRRGSND